MSLLKKIIIYLRPIRYFLRLFFHSPKYLHQKITVDFKKDSIAKKIKKNFHIVWCAGLPKSGTTLIENILSQLPMVQGNNSMLRIYDNSNLDHVHGITENMFKKFPRNKITYVKTHSHFSEKYIDIANKYNSKIIISLRDIRDAMISRYFHVKNDKTFLRHNLLKDLNFKEGFILSLSQSLNRDYDAIDWQTSDGNFKKPIEYYYKWIENWKNFAEKNENCLILWFEDYVKDPKKYINKIIKHLEFDSIDVDELYLKLESNKKFLKKRNLEENLNLIEPQTFRKGTYGDWKTVLDEEILEKFYSFLPGDISKIEYKNQ